MFSILGNVTDVFLSEEKSGAFGRNTDAETIAVIIADLSAQLFAAFQHHRDLGMGINK